MFNTEYLGGTNVESAESGLDAPSLGSTTTKKHAVWITHYKTLPFMLMQLKKQCIKRRSEYLYIRKEVFLGVGFCPNSVQHNTLTWDRQVDIAVIPLPGSCGHTQQPAWVINPYRAHEKWAVWLLFMPAWFTDSHQDNASRNKSLNVKQTAFIKTSHTNRFRQVVWMSSGYSYLLSVVKHLQNNLLLSQMTSLTL